MITSKRQIEVLELLAKGKCNKEIAWEMQITLHTVEKHREHAMKIAGAHDVINLLKYAIVNEIIDCPCGKGKKKC